MSQAVAACWRVTCTRSRHLAASSLERHRTRPVLVVLARPKVAITLCWRLTCTRSRPLASSLERLLDALALDHHQQHLARDALNEVLARFSRRRKSVHRPARAGGEDARGSLRGSWKRGGGRSGRGGIQPGKVCMFAAHSLDEVLPVASARAVRMSASSADNNKLGSAKRCLR